jgi:1-deoxy-D-xylulose 5-phosphate reductoisomerase
MNRNVKITIVSAMFAAGPAAIATRRRHVAAFQYASGPSASRSSVRPFSAGLRLEFEPPDLERFPLLALARASGERGGTYPCAFNAANEVAVAAFLDGRIGFLEIAGLVHDALDEVGGAPAGDLAELVEADQQARRLAERRLAPV